jgi:hypothetical protein
MKDEKHNFAKLKPLLVGRLSRVVAGAATLVAVPYVGFAGEDSIVAIALLVLGLSFVIGGLVANPGCEITSLLNLVLPTKKRLHVM